MRQGFNHNLLALAAYSRTHKKAVVSLVIAVLLPTVIFTWVGLMRPVSFDGAMNLQVAQNLAEHGRYERHYVYLNSTPDEKVKGVRAFPSEVETNGPYTLVAALGISLFGESQFGLQFASIIYIIGMAVLIWWILKRWLVFAAIAPGLILLSLPAAFDTSLGGYGEIPAIFFVLLAFVFVMQAATRKTRQQVLKYISLGFLALGAAYTTKTYLIGALPAMIVGVAIVAYARRELVSFKQLVLAFLCLMVFPILYELFRFISFASASAYVAWWKNQLKNILYQAGVLHSTGPYAADHKHSIFEKLSGQLHSLVHIFGYLPLFSLLLVTGLIIAAVYGYGRWRSPRALLRSTGGVKYGAMLGMLLTMVATYVAWWLVLLPATKTFIRRVFPIAVPLEIALVLIATICFSIYFSPQRKRQSRDDYKLFVIGKGLTLMYAAALCLLLISLSLHTMRGMAKEPYLSLADYKQSIKALKSLPANSTLYGQNWWSSPVISLMADKDLKNLDLVDVCALSPQKDFIVWDKIASGITKSATPTTPTVSYAVYRKTDSATIFRLSPNPTYCGHP